VANNIIITPISAQHEYEYVMWAHDTLIHLGWPAQCVGRTFKDNRMSLYLIGDASELPVWAAMLRVELGRYTTVTLQ